MKKRGIKEKCFSFLKEHKLTIILFIICGLLLTLIPITASKYVTDKEVGKIDLTITPPKAILVGQKKLNANFPSNVTKVIFGKYSDYPNEFDKTDGISVGDGTSIDKIKLYNVSDSTSNTSTAYILSDKDIYANLNCSFMFYNLPNLQSITFDNFNTSEVTNMGYMFASCTNLTSLDLSKFDTSKVMAMDCMFRKTPLTSLDLSSFNTSKVTTMYAMFGNCTNLTNLTLSSKFDTSNVTDMKYMFTQCSKLTNLDLSSFNTSKVEDMKYMFNECSALTTIYVSEYNTELNTGWTTAAVTSSNNSDKMFYKCTSLVGGKGTKYNSSITNKTYARIDGGKSKPGYFKNINPES